MKQLFLFDAPLPTQKCLDPIVSTISYWKLYVDGAARNNPGPAGAGLYLLQNDDVVRQQGFFLGSKTNNQAEYLALLLGIYYVTIHNVKNDPLLILSDSQLLVRQFKGLYKVKHPELRPLYLSAQQMLKGMNLDFAHIPREENEQADALANSGIDNKIPVLPAIKIWLRSYDIVV